MFGCEDIFCLLHHVTDGAMAWWFGHQWLGHGMVVWTSVVRTWHGC